MDAVAAIPLNLLALFWIVKRKSWGPILLIIISVGNRLLSQFMFIGGIHLIFVTWMALLLVFAYVELRGLSNVETLFLSGGIYSTLLLLA
ncbi:MAG: hypothetical protein ACLQO7_04395 [Candidatus Bathyarchaeia archaeon]